MDFFQMDQTPAQTALFQLIHGQWVSRAIQIAAQLGIADLLASGPKSVTELAQATQVHEQSLARLLRALCSVEVFQETEAGTFAQSERSRYLCSDQSGSIGDFIRMLGNQPFLQPVAHLDYSIRTGKSAFEKIYGMDIWGYLGEHPDTAALFNQGMTGLSQLINTQVAQTYDFSSINTLADIGGGQGSFLATILRAYPKLRGMLFDQPSVIESAQTQIKDLGDRCTCVGGNFFATVPAGADAYVLKQVLHDWDDERSIQILTNCRRAMPPQRKILVVERVLRPGKADASNKFFDLFMLAIPGGQERTEDDFARIYEAAGFRLTRIVPNGSPSSVVEGVAV